MSRSVSYQSQISPLLERKCLECHLPPDGAGYLKSGMNLATHETLMSGSYYGEVIVPGDSKRSILNKLIEGRAGKDMFMPHKNGEKLTNKEIELIRNWVDQGAKNN